MSEAVSSEVSDRSKLMVTFYEEAIVDEKATNGWTEETFNYETQRWDVKRYPGAGHNVYRDVTFIEIRIPGNIYEIRRRQVRDQDKRDWPKQWAAYEATKTNPVIGTPIETLPWLTKGQALEWIAKGFKTAEQIRDTSDADGQKTMGLTDMRKRVTDYLAAVEGHTPILKLENEIKQRDQELASLKAQIQELSRRKGKD